MYRTRPLDSSIRAGANQEQDYNDRVADPVPIKQPVDGQQRHHHSAYAAEATGLLVIAVVLLILTIVRYWAYINWSVR